MALVSAAESAKIVLGAVTVNREDIARAKQWVLAKEGANVQGMAEEWLEEQHMSTPATLDAESDTFEESLKRAGESIGLRLAFYQALWELIFAGDLFIAGAPVTWEPKSIEYKTTRNAEGMSLSKLKSSYPERIERPKLATVVSADIDIFLKGIDIKSLASGIHEAIEQALACFRRGLYFPSTVMLAAATEAAWTEMGTALAKKLSDKKLENTVGDEQASIAKKVSEIKKAIESNGGSKAILVSAGKTKYEVENAEVWTTVLRDRRNALHWGKAKGFVADHSETASLLMAAQLHLATLEAIRLASK